MADLDSVLLSAVTLSAIIMATTTWRVSRAQRDETYLHECRLAVAELSGAVQAFTATIQRAVEEARRWDGPSGDGVDPMPMREEVRTRFDDLKVKRSHVFILIDEQAVVDRVNELERAASEVHTAFRIEFPKLRGRRPDAWQSEGWEELHGMVWRLRHTLLDRLEVAAHVHFQPRHRRPRRNPFFETRQRYRRHKTQLRRWTQRTGKEGDAPPSDDGN